jgi:hypothetical protein
LLATGQLTEGGEYDVDFDHQFLEAEKYDSKRTYKGFDGYSPGHQENCQPFNLSNYQMEKQKCY